MKYRKPGNTGLIVSELIKWTEWTGAPPHAAEMAMLSGGLDKAGPDVVYMKWYPGSKSAPHRYATERFSVVLSGTWWVSSGADFLTQTIVSVPAGGFVRRVARTWHYDGVKRGSLAPALIAIFGDGPVNLKLADPQKPGWRWV